MKRKFLIAFALLFASEASGQILNTPGATVAEVADRYRSCHFRDTVYYEERDPEGHSVVMTLRYVPITFAGRTGYMEVGFDRRGRATRTMWRKGSELYLHSGDDAFAEGVQHNKCDGDSVDFTRELDEAERNCDLSDLENGRAELQRIWGKPKRRESESRIAYSFSGPLTRMLWLSEGTLSAGWAKKD